MILRLVLDAGLMAVSASGLLDIALGVVLVSGFAAVAAWLLPPAVLAEPPRRRDAARARTPAALPMTE